MKSCYCLFPTTWYYPLYSPYPCRHFLFLCTLIISFTRFTCYTPSYSFKASKRGINLQVVLCFPFKTSFWSYLMLIHWYNSIVGLVGDSPIFGNSMLVPLEGWTPDGESLLKVSRGPAFMLGKHPAHRLEMIDIQCTSEHEFLSRMIKT